MQYLALRGPATLADLSHDVMSSRNSGVGHCSCRFARGCQILQKQEVLSSTALLRSSLMNPTGNGDEIAKPHAKPNARGKGGKPSPADALGGGAGSKYDVGKD